VIVIAIINVFQEGERV